MLQVHMIASTGTLRAMLRIEHEYFVVDVHSIVSALQHRFANKPSWVNLPPAERAHSCIELS